MKNKLLLVLSLATVLASLFAISVFAGQHVTTWDASLNVYDSVSAELYLNSTYEGKYDLVFSGEGEMKNYDYATDVPWVEYRNDIISVTIGDGITSIGSSALSLPYAKSVKIGKDVNAIGDYAFNGCYSLKNIILPDELSKIGKYAFQHCIALKGIFIPSGVSYIGDCAFWECSSIQIFVGAPKSISDYWHTDWNYARLPVFWNHSHSYVNCECACGYSDCVEKWDFSATENDSVTAYLVSDTENDGYYKLFVYGYGEMKDGPYANNNAWKEFYVTKINEIIIGEGITSVGSGAFHGCSSVTSVQLPSTLCVLGSYAFASTAISEIEFPSSLTTIDMYAFAWCNDVKEFNISENVTSIGYAPFASCDSLLAINVSAANPNYKSVGGVLYTKDGKNIINYPSGKSDTYFQIPVGVEHIGNATFAACNSLVCIDIPNTVTSFGSVAFMNCLALEKIIVPESVTKTEIYSVYCCTSLTVYCEAEAMPSGWNYSWNYSNVPVIWGYISEDECIAGVFTFKGYSFSPDGGFAVGFEINRNMLDKYEEITKKSLEIGVVFAGYDNLGGNQPLDQNGNPIPLSVGKVIKGNISSFDYDYYDFMITDISDSIKDVKLVIAGYIFDGNTVKYVQENIISDTVSGISYNEAVLN